MQMKRDHLDERDDRLSTEPPIANVLPFVTRAEFEERALRTAGKGPAVAQRDPEHDDDPGPPAA